MKRPFAITVLSLALAPVCAVIYELDRLSTAAVGVMQATATIPDLVYGTVNEQSERIRTDVHREMTLLRRDLRAVSGDALKTLDGRLEKTSAQLSGVATTQLDATNKTILQMTGNLDRVFAASVGTLGQVNSTLQDVSTLAVPMKTVVDLFADDLPLVLDCEDNPDCLPNRMQGTLKGVENASIAFGTAAPQVAKSVTTFSASAASLAASVAAKKHWWQRLLF